MYVIKRYAHPIGRPNCVRKESLSTGRRFVLATSSAEKFSSPELAASFWMSIHTNFYKFDVWVEGPRGGRYHPFSGKRLK